MTREQINIKLPPGGRERIEKAVELLSRVLGISATKTDVLLHGLSLLEEKYARQDEDVTEKKDKQ